MYCGICNSEIEVYLDDDGIDYIMPCSHCTSTSFEEGVVNGFKLAGRDPSELASLEDR